MLIVRLKQLNWAGGALLLLFLFFISSGTAAREYEHVSFWFAPSTEKAYAYGSRHLDAPRGPLDYDIDRAEYWFDEVVRQDAEHAYAHHQLARIAFLRGAFVRALNDIDTSIRLQEEPSPSSFYVRGLILGFMGRYDAAAKDFERFLLERPENWAALNDYAWVLLKAKRYAEAERAAAAGLIHAPVNPWLLNSRAIALYELARYEEALAMAQAAKEAAAGVTEEQWLTAYPGNDPRIAEEGIAALRESMVRNIHIISEALDGSGVQY